MVTGEGDVRLGVQAMKEGADDYLLKPLNIGAVMVSINQVLERKKLESELENYRRHLEEMVEQRTAQLRTAKSRIEQGYDETLHWAGPRRRRRFDEMDLAVLALAGADEPRASASGNQAKRSP